MAQGRAGTDDLQDYTGVPIEQLMNVDVTDAFKSPIPLMKVPAAIYVVNQEMIRRSGVQTLPEALKLVPGVEVSRIGVDYYSISIRGFGNYLASNKILVLLDGRTLYSPYQNTVYWEIEDVLMQDIDRIEVIMGPGGSLWGANAVNGVINIITKNSKDTKGGLLVQSTGDLLLNRSIFQYGGRISDDATYRVYGKYGINQSAKEEDLASAGDNTSLYELGFRTDVKAPGQNTVLVEGETAQYRIGEQQPTAIFTKPYNLTYTNSDLIQTDHVLGKLTHEERSGGQTSLLAYFDLVNYPYTDQASSAAMVDIEVDHRSPTLHGQEVAFGAGFRYELNDGMPGPSELLLPSMRRDTIFDAYGQDIFHLNRIDSLTVGMKIEHNDVSGYEFQPNVRYSHSPSDKETLWAAIGKADRTPSQSELNVFSVTSVNGPSPSQPMPVAQANIGTPYLEPETVIANEIGLREKLNKQTTFDIAAFYNIYNNLIYLAPGAPFTTNLFGPTITVDPTYFRNGDRGQTYGFEASGTYSFSPALKTDISFSALQHTHFEENSDLAAPSYQAILHVGWNPTKRLELDGRLHWTDAIFSDGVPAYDQLDLHAIWKLSGVEDLSLGGYDLLTPRHFEFAQGAYIFRSYVLEYKRRF